MKCVFKKYRCAPPITQKYRRGSALLAVVLILAVISSMLSVGTAKLTQAAINSTSTNKITLQAQQYAASKADIVKATKYDELTAQNKTVISNSDGFYDEVSVSAESEYPGNSNISQRECIIRVYKDSETLPRSSLKLMRYSVSTDASSVPQGSIIPWYGDKANIPDGFALCDGTKGTPDLRDRFLVGAGSTYSLGAKGGEAMHKLVGAELPSQSVDFAGWYLDGIEHEHVSKNYKGSIKRWSTYGGNITSGMGIKPNTPIVGRFSIGAATSGKDFTSNNGLYFESFSSALKLGNDQPHENRPPYYALYYIMKL